MIWNNLNWKTLRPILMELSRRIKDLEFRTQRLPAQWGSGGGTGVAVKRFKVTELHHEYEELMFCKEWDGNNLRGDAVQVVKAMHHEVDDEIIATKPLNGPVGQNTPYIVWQELLTPPRDPELYMVMQVTTKLDGVAVFGVDYLRAT